jgi:hypothetical protein
VSDDPADPDQLTPDTPQPDKEEDEDPDAVVPK